MNVNQRIETALSGLVSGAIWPLSKPLTEDPATFIVYNPELVVSDQGDNLDQDWAYHMQIHWHSKGISDYLSAVDTMIAALHNAGITVTDIPFHEYQAAETGNRSQSGTGYTHVCLSCLMEKG